jgi:hypothetical protein
MYQFPPRKRRGFIGASVSQRVLRFSAQLLQALRIRVERSRSFVIQPRIRDLLSFTYLQRISSKM